MGSVPLFWRLKKSRYNLIGTKCSNCKAVFFPPKPLCPECRRKGVIEDFKFSGNGEVVSFTVIHAAPEGFEKYTPYAVALIQLEEGTTISGQIIGEPSKIKMGSKVKATFRRMHEDSNEGHINYGTKFELVDGQ